jgi:hypothetical protein
VVLSTLPPMNTLVYIPTSEECLLKKSLHSYRLISAFIPIRTQFNSYLLMSHICGVSKKFGEWYQKANKTEDTNKLTLLAFKIMRRQSNNV